MNKMNWNEISFLLSENIKSDISERDFEYCVIQALNVLGWKEFSGNIETRPSIKIGASNRITPDFVIKSDEGKKVFVIEIKQPSLPLNSNFQQQLFSYMRQLKLEYGILIGERIQIFYDGLLSEQEHPILLENIIFERDNNKGIKFVETFSKSTFSFNLLEQFRLKSLEKINREKDFKKLTNEIISKNFEEKVNDLIKQELLNEYDDKLIESVLNDIDINITKKFDYKETLISNSLTPKYSSDTSKLGVIASIKQLITTIPKTQDKILEELAELFPER
ncbi:MAG: hypothetical protein COA67_01000 [Lutibacter sp.]|nr:MAG: hypothetical protein COA67_01000 [Lutibacter sp.]